MKKKIIVHTRSGLANRMRAISSSIFLKHKIDAEMYVIWKQDNGLKANYHDLFQNSNEFTVINDKSKYDFLMKGKSLVNSKFPIVRNASTFYNKLMSKWIGVDVIVFDEDVVLGYDHVYSKAINQNNIYIHTCGEFVDYPQGIQNFVPSEEINGILKLELSNFDDDTIGMHIRRTDNKKAIEKSPLHLYENKISEIVANNSKTKIFLATDDNSVEEQLLSKFPDNILKYNKTYGRDSFKGIQDAIVEMYLLSHTSKIYGSFYSSFSEVAAKIGNIELEVLKLD